ncbi:MAG: 4Fe-4S dicluster domain-containing protein [Acidobacteriaceae bacterium]|nr:4Fe-4S dicluster domain-containing protein [Acidobacteriaceae bacterium]
MGASSLFQVVDAHRAGPAQTDLDKCVHCGLCLNACPTYRELGVEMDSPRGRIYQMNQVANGAAITPSYRKHLDLCLACRGCETACPSGVPYGRMIEAAREHLEQSTKQSLWRRTTKKILLDKLIPSRTGLQIAGAALYAYQASGVQALVRTIGVLKPFGKLADWDALSPEAQIPFFFRRIGKTFPAIGETRYRVAFLAGCIANVAFARLNEATIRVLRKNGCEVVIPPGQGCCGALHLHTGMAERARDLARNNIDAFGSEGVRAIVTNAAGCGSTLKEYGLLADDPSYQAKAQEFSGKLQDVTEFLAGIPLNAEMKPLNLTVTYQDSCHLAHGQKIKQAPRQLLKSIPGVSYREMPMADVCCGSAGIYNLAETDMAMRILKSKMEHVNSTRAEVIATANPGCLLQLKAGARLYGSKQRVVHVIELLDEAYSGG